MGRCEGESTDRVFDRCVEHPCDLELDADVTCVCVREDMARELLDLVMDGPELEMIWASFQHDPEGSKRPATENDEEDEEALMQATDP